MCVYPRLSINLKRDSWSLSLVFVYIMPYAWLFRRGRVRSSLHGIHSLLCVAA